MLKLFRSQTVKVTVKIALIIVAIWFYLTILQPTFTNQILLGCVIGSLLFSLTLDLKQAIARFLGSSRK
ncbi:hypothetical protein K08M3_49540 [Vibrio alginolyticus]|jgi:hypothetical protein|uniref:Uncharacterized protein n=1 Tax=Vibrio alginolyticus TaxID=663 RepID=A0A1W6TLD1_VIBAL|nr:hypothetical protein K04M1_49410 [Vibrio alginolyticus]MEA5230119.1 hypothetical protein [Vibrio parahaemolyticus]ARP11569.1 hypothetical protein K04M3_50000 [Vibrio alginolyticus]ARP16650.1 hypothetical protein K04M5_49980 [Vibrio alginolyticus]ARP21669.1 hypothetical protein K05K4_49600 [Vibrio alginolyticus]